MGAALLVAGPEGLHWLALGDDPTALQAAWRRSHPTTQTLGRPPAAWVEAVHAALEGNSQSDLPPLAPHGTPFQRRVWAALRMIPAGTRLSYRELAQRIGQPRAARAVAAACAANPIAVLIPCHRVVRTDGTLGGYRWGWARKHALLHRESRTASCPRLPWTASESLGTGA